MKSRTTNLPGKDRVDTSRAAKMRNWRNELEEGSCKGSGCNTVKRCMCALAEEMCDEIERLHRGNVMKIAKLTLSFPWFNHEHRSDKDRERYRVEKITNSVEFIPGEMLTKDQVAQLCKSDLWSVTT